MPDVTFTEETLGYVTFFQGVTETRVLDCMADERRLVFVVQKGDLGKAIGKGGEHIAHLRRKMNKEIHVVEFSEDPAEFVANVFKSHEVKKVELEDRNGVKHATVTVETTEKGRAIGREGRNLKMARDLIARHHDIQSVSVA